MRVIKIVVKLLNNICMQLFLLQVQKLFCVAAVCCAAAIVVLFTLVETNDQVGMCEIVRAQVMYQTS